VKGKKGIKLKTQKSKGKKNKSKKSKPDSYRVKKVRI
jgi:hypothetical protein